MTRQHEANKIRNNKPKKQTHRSLRYGHHHPCVGTPHLIIHSSSDGHVSFLDLSLQWNENSESNVVKSVLLILMTVKILMKPIRVKQKRDFWKRNQPTNKKRSEKKTLFLPSGMLRILFGNYNRRGILSSPLILYPLTFHLFLSTISDNKKKSLTEETIDILVQHCKWHRSCLKNENLILYI